jgi:hypothetical protein
VLSVQSVLGQALSGRKVGDEFSYVTPTGRELPVKLLQAEPEVGGGPGRALERAGAGLVTWPVRRQARPGGPLGAGQLRGSAWSSFTGSSRPVGVT